MPLPDPLRQREIKKAALIRSVLVRNKETVRESFFLRRTVPSVFAMFFLKNGFVKFF